MILLKTLFQRGIRSGKIVGQRIAPRRHWIVTTCFLLRSVPSLILNVDDNVSKLLCVCVTVLHSCNEYFCKNNCENFLSFHFMRFQFLLGFRFRYYFFGLTKTRDCPQFYVHCSGNGVIIISNILSSILYIFYSILLAFINYYVLNLSFNGVGFRCLQGINTRIAFVWAT